VNPKYVIVDGKLNLIKQDGKVLFFRYPSQAVRYMNKKCGNSPYLTVRRWREKKENPLATGQIEPQDI